MRCGNIRIHVEIPVYADKNNCFCDDNHVSYSIPAIRKACETASNLPIIQYDEQGTEKSWALHNQLNGIRMVLLRWTDNCYLEGQMKLSSLEKMIASFQWSLAR